MYTGLHGIGKQGLYANGTATYKLHLTISFYIRFTHHPEVSFVGISWLSPVPTRRGEVSSADNPLTLIFSNLLRVGL